MPLEEKKLNITVCHQDTLPLIARCDEGYSGEYCVPSQPLPMMLRDDFNREKPLNDDWLEIYGGEPTKMCGIIVSGNALTFSEVGQSMIGDW